MGFMDTLIGLLTSVPFATWVGWAGEIVLLVWNVFQQRRLNRLSLHDGYSRVRIRTFHDGHDPRHVILYNDSDMMLAYARVENGTDRFVSTETPVVIEPHVAWTLRLNDGVDASDLPLFLNIGWQEIIPVGGHNVPGVFHHVSARLIGVRDSPFPQEWASNM